MARKRAYRAIRSLIRGSGKIKKNRVNLMAPKKAKKSFARRNWKGIAAGLGASHGVVGAAAGYKSLEISSDLRNWSPSTNKQFEKQNRMIKELSARNFQLGLQNIAKGTYKKPKRRGR